METTCFFCQNLLSDFVEGLLHSSRHEELKGHLKDCAECRGVHEELNTTLRLLKNVPTLPLSHELALRISEAAQSERGLRRWTRRGRSATIAVAGVAAVAYVLGAAFPDTFPWARWFRSGPEPVQWVRYYPLMQGGREIIDEQANWLHLREPFSRSLWEEGGLSPEEFEKTFQPAKVVDTLEAPPPSASAGAAKVSPAVPAKSQNGSP